MRKIRCQSCPNPKYAGTPIWIVFKGARICETCRLTAIEYLRDMGFSLARPHPFLDELCGVQTDEKESS